MKKIAIIVPMLAPYRITFYNDLISSTSNSNEWCIFHGIKKTDDGRPPFTGEVSFPNQFYTTSKFNLGPYLLKIHNGLYRSLKKYNPDIVIIIANAGEITNWKIAAWAKRKKKVNIFWVCSYDSGKAKSFFKRIKQKIMKWHYNYANHFITYSTHAKNLLKNLSFSEEKIDIAYNGIDIKPLNNKKIIADARELRKKLAQHNETVFLYVGGLSEMKNPMLLLNAFIKFHKKNRNVQLWIVGDGPLADVLQKRISDSNLNDPVKYFGRIIEEVDVYFKAADWFVLPGSGGLALNQAMYWETPCIASFADGTEEDLVFDKITGYRFIEKSEKSLEKILEEALKTSDEKYNQMAKISNYLIEQRSNTDEMIKVFIKALSKFN